MLPRTLEPEVMDSVLDAASYAAMDHSEPNDRFVARLQELGAFGAMLDIGTGPGDIPLLVVQRMAEARVLGVDRSAPMLAIAQRRRAASPHGDRLRFAQVDAKALPYPAASFDTVFSNTILHHLADPRACLSEAMRVLRPGGVLLIRDLFRPDSAARVEELVGLHAGGADAVQRQLFRQSLHAALTPGELRGLVAELGWRDVEVTIDTDRHASVQRRRRAGGQGDHAA